MRRVAVGDKRRSGAAEVAQRRRFEVGGRGERGDEVVEEARTKRAVMLLSQPVAGVIAALPGFVNACPRVGAIVGPMDAQVQKTAAEKQQNQGADAPQIVSESFFHSIGNVNDLVRKVKCFLGKNPRRVDFWGKMSAGAFLMIFDFSGIENRGKRCYIKKVCKGMANEEFSPFDCGMIDFQIIRFEWTRLSWVQAKILLWFEICLCGEVE